MKKVLLFGASGNVGKAIARETITQGYDLTVVVRSESKAASLAAITPRYIVADVTNKSSLSGICSGFDVVISALGKSVSPADNSKPSFYDIDLVANCNILDEAVKSGVHKFVYVSAFGAEHHTHLTYFKVHHDFSEKLKQSGIDYAIVKPPAVFSAFVEMLDMARKGMLVNMGAGDKKTNPIFEGDLAKICVDAIGQTNAEIEVGGENLYTRWQLNNIVLQAVAPGKKLRSVPMGVVKIMLPVMKLINRNLYDKLAFFTEMMEKDTIAPKVGPTRFEDYIAAKAKE